MKFMEFYVFFPLIQIRFIINRVLINKDEMTEENPQCDLQFRQTEASLFTVGHISLAAANAASFIGVKPLDASRLFPDDMRCGRYDVKPSSAENHFNFFSQLLRVDECALFMRLLRHASPGCR